VNNWKSRTPNASQEGFREARIESGRKVRNVTSCITSRIPYLGLGFPPSYSIAGMSSDGHSTLRPGSSSETSLESDIELSNLEDVAVTPNPQLQPGKHLSFSAGTPDDSDEEDDLENGDDGNRGLLSPRRVQSRGRDKIGIWMQVKGIAIEVRIIPFPQAKTILTFILRVHRHFC
jgi:hypothetical protein